MSKLDYGRIINVASNAGIENSGPVTFTTTKAALVAYTRSIGRVLAIEYPHIVAMQYSLESLLLLKDIGENYNNRSKESRTIYCRKMSIR